MVALVSQEVMLLAQALIIAGETEKTPVPSVIDIEFVAHVSAPPQFIAPQVKVFVPIFTRHPNNK